jgi:hypothetical protein
MMVYMAISINYAIAIVRMRVPTSEGILVDATGMQIPGALVLEREQVGVVIRIL